MDHVIGNRYELLYALGTGGMGAIYAAYDRLTGQTVALKRVVVDPEDLLFNSRIQQGDSTGLLLSLTQEFRILASLRHPHIISVLDYGFDTARRPYITMELLVQPQTLLQAGRGCPLSDQVDLLLQALQALAYLHRRGILHRDLKPENILVCANRLRLLDFGLSVTGEQAQRATSSGTILYMAPEVLQGHPVTPASDLYAIGVMAYELLVGRHPFYPNDIEQFFDIIFTVTPDLTDLRSTPKLAEVIGKLLAKDSQQRYQTAQAVIVDLCAATGHELPAESKAIRESFIQAATFVGREGYLTGLLAALAAARRGHGSAWLIGGESGVGKSRLLDELRTHALVDGVQVLRGQGVEGGGLAYQLWRAPLRQLILCSPLSDLDAGVLKEVVPDISHLLQRAIPDAPPLAGLAGQQRLISTIRSLFQNVQQPLLLLLDDLQWATESLAILNALTDSIAQLPLFIVCAYRDDERPQLTAELPQMQTVRLTRLTAAEIAQLSTAMLGMTGEHPQVVDFLTRETEGNTFFITEVVRTWAEEVGSLAAIGPMSLPRRILVGGMKTILQRRLARIPAAAFSLFKLAAVVGRQLDLAVLHVLAPITNLEQWLLSGSEARILEIQEQQWRFAHDKLRETILADLSHQEAAALHRQVATAIEQVYPQDQSQFLVLFEHWYAAREHTQALIYARLASQHLLDLGLASAAEAVLAKALPLLPPGQDDPARLVLLHVAAAAHRSLGNYEQALTIYQESILLAQQLGNGETKAAALLGLSQTVMYQGDYIAGQRYAEQSLAVAQSTGEPASQTRALSVLTTIASDQGKIKDARRYTEAALALCRTAQDLDSAVDVWCDIGICFQLEGQPTEAEANFQESLRLCRLLGNQHKLFRPMCNLGFLFLQHGRFGQAVTWLEEALAVNRATGDLRQRTIGLATLGLTRVQMGDYQVAYEMLQEALTIAQRIGSQVDQAMALIALCDVSQEVTLAESSEQYGQQALALAYQCRYQEAVKDAWISLGHVARQQGDLALAAQRYEAALATCHTVNWAPDKRVGALHGLALTAWLAGDQERCEHYLAEAQGINQTTDNPFNTACTTTGWLLYHLAQHNVVAVPALLTTGLEAARTAQSKAQLINLLACQAWYHVQIGQIDLGWQLYQLAMEHPATPAFTRQKILWRVQVELPSVPRGAPEHQGRNGTNLADLAGWLPLNQPAAFENTIDFLLAKVAPTSPRAG